MHMNNIDFNINFEGTYKPTIFSNEQTSEERKIKSGRIKFMMKDGTFITGTPTELFGSREKLPPLPLDEKEIMSVVRLQSYVNKLIKLQKESTEKKNKR